MNQGEARASLLARLGLLGLALVGLPACGDDTPASEGGSGHEGSANEAPVVDPALLHELLGEAVEVDDDDVRADGLLIRLAFEPLIRETGPVSLQQVQSQGYRLSGVADGSPLWLLGLRDGDVLTTVDGDPILGREHALRSAWQQRPRRFELGYLREGKHLRLQIAVDRSPAWRSTAEPELRVRDRPSLPPPATTSDRTAFALEVVEGLRCVEGEAPVIARCEITRAARDKLAENPEQLARQARIVPALRDGEQRGFKLYGIRRATLPNLLGFHNGDLLLDVSGHELDSLDGAMEAYAAVRERELVVLTLERRGQTQRLEFSFVDELSGPPAALGSVPGLGDTGHEGERRAVSPDLKDPFARD